MADMEEIITDAVNDSINGTEEVADTPEVETSSEPVEASTDASSEEQAPEVGESVEVASPARSAAPEADSGEPQDEFSKIVGMPQMGVGGRENRIPYSRVKKITEKAVGEIAEAALGRKLNQGEKAVDVVKAHVAKLPELQTKVTDYEARLEAVARFEDVMANDPEKFLTMLAKVPAYQGFFDYFRQAQEVFNRQSAAPETPATPDPADVMPEPDETLEDGSKVYSMEGLKSLLAWNAKQVESRVNTSYEQRIKQIQDRFAPMETEWQARRKEEAIRPMIQKQIAEAKTWTLFNESEDEILAVLQKDKNISLEGAYRQVVFPKLVAERNKVRQEVLAEVKAAPTATSVAARTASKPVAQPEGPRNMEDVIRAEVEKLKARG